MHACLLTQGPKFVRNPQSYSRLRGICLHCSRPELLAPDLVSLRVAQHPLKVICNPGFEGELIKPESALRSSRLEGCFANLGRPINHQNERNYPYGKKIPRRSNDCS